MARILVVGMNPAWQSVLCLPEFQLNGVNRAREVFHLASGKGINCARVLNKLGHDVTLLQLLAGVNGKRCLDACEKMGIRSLHAWVEGETRSCLTLRDEKEGAVSELIEPFALDWRPEIGSGLFRALADFATFDALVIMGSLPAGVPGNFYREILMKVPAELRILDALQGIGVNDLPSVHWVKVNKEEWLHYRNSNPGKLPEGVRTLISNGPRSADFGIGEKRVGRITPPSLGKILNPIGAGDTVTAGLLDQILKGKEPRTAAIMALAMGAASCLDILPAHWDNAKAIELVPQFQFEQMPHPGVAQ